MRRLLLIALASLAAILVAGQLALPLLAERHVSGQIEDRGGRGVHVDISAFPAVKLLFHRADDVTVRIGAYRSGTAGLADQLVRTADTDRLDARTARLDTGLLTLSDARLRKSRGRLLGEATVTNENLRAALPPGFDVRPVAVQDGQLIFEGTATVLGFRASLRLRALVRDGAIVVEPEGIPLASLAAITVFRDPRIQVTALGARAVDDGFVVSATARLA